MAQMDTSTLDFSTVAGNHVSHLVEQVAATACCPFWPGLDAKHLHESRSIVRVRRVYFAGSFVRLFERAVAAKALSFGVVTSVLLRGHRGGEYHQLVALAIQFAKLEDLARFSLSLCG
jgi:hypothetical protein